MATSEGGAAAARWPAWATLLCTTLAVGSPVGLSACADRARNGGPDGAAAPSCPVEILADGEDRPSHPMVGATRLYWATVEGIRAIPLQGGAPTTILATSHLTGLVARGDDVYFADLDQGIIGRLPGGVATGDPEIVAEMRASGLTIVGDLLYYAQIRPGEDVAPSAGQGSIGRLPLTGGEPEVLATGLEGPIRLTVSDSAIVFASGLEWIGVQRLDLASGAIDEVGPPMPSNLAGDEGGAYFVTSEGLPARLVYVPGQGPPQTLADDLDQLATVAVDDGGLYLFGASGRLSRRPRAGGAPTTLAIDLGRDQQRSPPALDADWIYLALPRSGRVLRVSKASNGDTSRCVADPTCPAPVGDAVDIAATPRADPFLEQVALKLDGTVVARQATYDRVVSDVAAIADQLPTGVTVGSGVADNGRTLLLSVSESTGRAMQAGTYSAWDCLNDFYGLRGLLVEYSELNDCGAHG